MRLVTGGGGGLRALFGLRRAKLHGQLAAAVVNRARVRARGGDARDLAATLDEGVVDVERIELRRGDAQRTARNALIGALLEVLDDGHRRPRGALAQNALRLVHVEQTRARAVLGTNIDTFLTILVDVRRERGEFVRTETHATEPGDEILGVAVDERNQTFGIGTVGVTATDANFRPQERVGADEQELVVLIVPDFPM